MKVAIMQPYFLPYIGYFQLINCVDKFIIYDNIQYTKKGWINRNRFLQNGKDEKFSIPIKKASDYLDVCEREISSDFKKEKLLGQLKNSYLKAPYFAQAYPLIENIVRCEETNLFKYIYKSVISICHYFNIETEVIVSSQISIDASLKCQDRVISMCKAINTDTYINAIGGLDLYSPTKFRENNLGLKFLKTKDFEYRQYNNEFIPWLSIVDVIMFNSKETVSEFLMNGFDLIEGAK